MKRANLLVFIIVALFMTAGPVRAEGPIIFSGSTTFCKRILEPVKAELEKKTGTKIEIRCVGTIMGLKELIKGQATAAMVSAPLDIAFLEAGVPDEGTYQEHVILKDILVPIVHPGNPVKTLTWEQICDINSGKVANWKAVGGPDRQIAVMIPPKSSGTRKFLQETVMNGAPFAGGAFTAMTTREEIDLVAQAPIGIGVLSEGLVKMSQGKVKIVKSKPITRQLSIVTKGQPSKDLLAVIKFLTAPQAKRYFK